MKKFTFITEYRGGTYISQFEGFDLNALLLVWCEKLDSRYFTKKKKEQISIEIKGLNNTPVRVSTLDNVWCSCFLSGKFFLLLTIVETV
jgi:hypothetical protein